MKRILLILLLPALLALAAGSRTVSQQGVAYRYNGKAQRTPLGDVFIKASTALNGVKSNQADGTFMLELKDLESGSPIGSVTVVKRGMIVFNQQAVDEWNVRKEPLRLILCDADEFQRQKDNLIAIGRRQAQKKYDLKMAALEEEYAAEKLRAEEYYTRLDSLEKERQNSLRHMDEYADLFARIDQSEVDTIAQKAIDLFNRGENEAAIRLFERGDYMKKLDDAIRVGDQAREMRQLADSAETLANRDRDEAAAGLRVQISAYKLNNDWTKAAELLKQLADKLDDLGSLYEYYSFCMGQNNTREAEIYILKYIDKIDNTVFGTDELKQRMRFHARNSLATVYFDIHRYAESEEIFKAELPVMEKIAETNPSAVGEEIALIRTNLALLYKVNGRFAESEEMYVAALAAYRKLAEENPGQYAANLSLCLSKLADLYANTRRYDEGEKLYWEAFSIGSPLAEKDPEYEPDFVSILHNFALLLEKAGKQSDSEDMFRLALTIQERLVSKNANAGNPTLAAIRCSLADLYQNMGRYDESEKLFKSALEIRERLAKENPAQYEPDLAHTLHNLAIMYKMSGRSDESERLFKSSLEVFEKLMKVNRVVYAENVAKNLYNLGELYSKTGDIAASAEYYNRAVGQYRLLAEANPEVYSKDLAYVECEYADLCRMTGQYDAGEELYKSAIEIYGRLAEKDPAYLHQLAVPMNNLATLYKSTKRISDGEKYYLETLKIFERLNKKKPDIYNSYVARTKHSLAILYAVSNQPDKSEPLYKSALEMFGALRDRNPENQDIEIELSRVEFNLGILYLDNNQAEKGEALLKQALEIQERLSAADPVKYQSDEAMTLSELSFYYLKSDRIAEGEILTERGAEAYRQMNERNPGRYLDKMLDLYYNLGLCRANQGKYAEAIGPFEQTLSLAGMLSDDNGKAFSSRYKSLCKLIFLHYTVGNYRRSYELGLELLPLTDSLRQKDPEKWREEYASQNYYMAMDCLFSSNPAEAETYARSGLNVSPSSIYNYQPLADALLLQGKTTEAEDIYTAHRGALKDMFLDGIHRYEAAGIIPEDRKADFERIKVMLSE